MASQTVHFEQVLGVPPELAARAFTNSSLMRRWLCDSAATVDPHPGGRLYLAWNSGYYACGEYLQVEPGSIQFSWLGRGDPGAGRVTVTIEAGGSGSFLVLEHTLPDDGPAWQATCEQVEKGWQESLENLASVLESGLDLRFVNRPLLGLTFSDFNAEIARELGTPVRGGVRVDRVVEGLGAHAAGLQPDDVLAQLGETHLHSFVDIPLALAGKRAGDTLPVVFYRGVEKRTIEMTLSRRPLPEIPWEPGELALQARRRYDEIELEMDGLLAGVSELEADYHAEPGAWSVKEVLAHLLQGERALRLRLDEMVGGYESWNDGWGGNVQAHVSGTLQAYGSLAALTAEIKSSFAETVGFYAALPDNFVDQNKAAYWWLAYEALDEPYHYRSHAEQIREGIRAARDAEVK